MKQQTRRLAVVFGGALSIAAALVVAACSTDNGSTPLPGQTTPGTDSGKDTGSSNKDGETSSSGGDTGTGSNDSGTGADCSDVPTLHKTTSGFYCSFYKDGGAADAGGNSNCANGETCCNPGKGGGGAFGPSFCATVATKGGSTPAQACADQSLEKSGVAWVPTGGATYECGSKDNCGAGQTCCLYTDDADKANGDHVNVGPASGSNAPPAACKSLQGYKTGGSKCAASCQGADEIELCSETANTCAGGKTCTAFEAFSFRDLGYCK